MSERIINVPEWAIDYNGEPLFKDTEELIRCKDCKQCEKKGYRFYCNLNASYPEVSLEDFCSWGERK